MQNKIKNEILITSNISKEKNSNINKNTSLILKKEKAETNSNQSLNNNKAVVNLNDKKINTIAKTSKEKEEKISIEDALDDNNEVVKKDIKNNRWRIAPNAAPVYFNTIGEGSSIDPQFTTNAKSGEVNMSYGISASYAVNKKISVRSGINKVNLSYNTNDIIAFQSITARGGINALQNVNSNLNISSNTSFISSENFNADVSESLVSSNAIINQALGYIEIPLEIQYTLSDKKIGVNLIGGFSSFFLSNNELFSEQDNGTRTLIGEANNINEISYSANFGMGLNYKISKAFNLNLEPIFKYQFNTFNNTSGNFSPFFIGVYTGFSIKF